MKKGESSEGKDKIFDRIFKENAYNLFIPIIERKLDIHIKSYKVLPSELPRTLGRRVDFLCLVITEDEEEFILHVEFQTKNDHKMLPRISEYHGIMYRKHQLPIRHVVVFLGEGKARMQTQLKENEIFTGFDLINMSELNTEQLLSSQVPEVILLALLSNYEKDRAEAILRLIIRRLKAVVHSETDLKKYVEQLILLSKLRKLSKITDKIVHDMPVTYDYTEDFYYLKGIAAGREIANQQIEKEREKAEQEREKAKREREKAEQEKLIAAIKSLLSIDNLSIAQIAEAMNVTTEFVEHIKKSV